MVSLKDLFLFDFAAQRTQRHSFRLARRKEMQCEKHRTFVSCTAQKRACPKATQLPPAGGTPNPKRPQTKRQKGVVRGEALDSLFG